MKPPTVRSTFGLADAEHATVCETDGAQQRTVLGMQVSRVKTRGLAGRDVVDRNFLLRAVES